MSTGKRALLLTGLLLACAAFPLRLRYGFGPFRSFSILDLFLLLTPLWLLLVNWERPQRLVLGNRTVFAVLALPLVLAVVSLAWSQSPPQTLYYIAQTVLALAAYLLAVNLLQYLPPATALRCLTVFVVAAVATAALSFARVPGFAPDMSGMPAGSGEQLDFLASYYSRLSHPFWGLSNAFGGALAMFVPLLLGWYLATRQRWTALVAAGAFAAICLTLSRGVILALLVALLLCALCWRRHRATIALFTAAGATVVAFGLWLLAQWSPVVGEYLVGRLTAVTIAARLEQMAHALAAIKEAPLLGYGAGVVPRGEMLLAGGAHNTYLQAMLAFGLPLGLLLSICLLILAALLLLRRGPFAATDPLLTVAAGGALTVELLVFLTQAAFEGVLLRILVYLGMGIAVALLFRPQRQGAT